MKTARYRLEREMERVAEAAEARQWLAGEIRAVLEDESRDFTRKADYIGLSIASIDDKIKGIDEEIKELQALKAQMKEAKRIAQEVAAEVLGSYGISKIEGAAISSLTITPEKEQTKTKLIINDEEALIAAGYAKTVVDTEAVKEAMIFGGADERNRIGDAADLEIERITKPATVKVNKRRGKKATTIAEEVA